MSRGLAVVVYIILCFIWSSTWLMIKVGLEGAPPMTSAAFRFIISSFIIFAILLKLRIKLPASRRFILLSVYLGFFQMGIPYALVYWGEQHISSGLAAILFSIMPLFVAVFARFLIGDSLTVRKIAGILIGALGVYVIFAGNIAAGDGMGIWGMLALLISAILASLTSVIIKKNSGNYHPFASLFIPIALGGVLLAVWGLLFEDVRSMRLDPLTITSILYLGILGTVIAFGLYFWIIKHIDVTFLSYMTFIIPILACLLGWIFLHETLTINVLFGAGLIFAGIALATLRRNKTKGATDGILPGSTG
jgi:putative membrane protein PagO